MCGGSQAAGQVETALLDKACSPTASKWEDQSGPHDYILVQPTVQQAPEKAIVPAQLWCHPRSQAGETRIGIHAA